MSDTVQIVLIVAVTIIIVLIIFRRQLSNFFFKANKEGIEASLKTHKPTSGSGQDGDKVPGSNSADVSIRNNRIIGKKNEIDVGREDVAVNDNLMIGKEQKIVAKPDAGSPQENK
jgi:hypothetical protein